MATERPVLSYTESDRYKISQEDVEHHFLHRYYDPFKIRRAALKQRILERPRPENHPLRGVLDLKENEKCLIVGVITKYVINRPRILEDLYENEHFITKHRVNQRQIGVRKYKIEDTALKPRNPDDDDKEEEELTLEQIKQKYINRKSDYTWDARDDEKEPEAGPSNENKDDKIEAENEEDVFGQSFQDQFMDINYMELEDENLVVRLSDNIYRSNITTGCVAGLLGKLIVPPAGWEHRYFEVSTVIYPTTRIPHSWPKERPDAVLAIISGIEISGQANRDSTTINAINLFADWLSGDKCGSEEDRRLALRVERVLIAGNSLGCNEEKGVPIDLLPGDGDPFLQPWPQQSIPEDFFPQSELRGSMNFPTNPASFKLGGIDFLATSGKNVNEILEDDSKTESLDIMESMLRWQHIAPSTPHSIDTYPLDLNDPFILKRRPQVYICGNQTKADSRVVKSRDGTTLLISVPRFSKTRMVTLLDLKTMKIEYRFFGFF